MRRGWRTHQKVSTRATKSGTRRRSFHGRKLSSSAIRNEKMIVPSRTGRRICCGLSEPIAVLGFFRLGAPRPVGTPFFRGPRIVGPRRRAGLVGQHQHEAATVDPGGGLAYDAGETVLGLALDALGQGPRGAPRVPARHTA